MKDVAKLTGVAPSTVSRVLSGTAVAVPVSATTRERVHAAARELGYRPNPQARALRGAPTMLLGAIVRDITDPFFGSAVDALSLEARRWGYSVVLGNARERADEALALAAVLEARQCDAIVLVGDISGQPLLDDLRDAGRPVVELWQGSRPGQFARVGVDNRAGMDAALSHLAGLGHRRIAFCGDDAKADVRERAAAYHAFCARRGLEALAVATPNTPAGAMAGLDTLLDGPLPPTAVAAATDVLAFGVLHAAYARGLSVPDQLSVTGFDDISLAAAAVPPLTTVTMPVGEMVRDAVALAIHPLEGEIASSLRVTAPRLTVRASSGPVAAVA